MAMFADIHGNRYHLATWHAEARTAREDEALCAAAFDQDPNGTIKMRMVILNEKEELVTEPIDAGTHRYVRQPNGAWHVEKVTENETRAQTPRTFDEQWDEWKSGDIIVLADNPKGKSWPIERIAHGYVYWQDDVEGEQMTRDTNLLRVREAK